MFSYTGPTAPVQFLLTKKTLEDIQTLLDSQEFQTGAVQGFECPIVTDVAVSLVIDRPNEDPQVTPTIAGCLVPESGSPLAKLFRIFDDAKRGR